MKQKIILSFFVSLVLLQVVKAEVLTFERGGAFDSTGIVDPGDLTLEGGIISYADEFDGENSYQLGLGSTLVRYGLFDKFELRARNNGVLFNDRRIGFDNLGLGFKYAILNEQHGLLPILNLTTNFEIPVGIREYRNPGFSHSYNFSMSHSLVKELYYFVSFMLAVNSREDAAGEFSTIDLPYVFNLYYMFGDRLTIFTNTFGVWGLSSLSNNPVSQDFGLTYAFTEDFAMDLTFNFGLNESAPDFGIDFGFSVRLLD